MPAAGSIIIVTFNSARHIEACLRSLNQPDWERIVVDNASSDATCEAARAVPGTQVLANPDNRGFAAAANQGARAARGELLLFLNPDVQAQPGALAALRATAERTSAGALAGRLLDSTGATQVGFTFRRLPTLATALAETLLLNRLWPGNPFNRRYRCVDFDYDRPAEIEQPAGACLLVKRRAWESLGGFDPRFFPLWFEDVDLCHRLRQAGWTILYEPQARFLHAGAHSLAAVADRDRQLYWYQNLLCYFRKHHSRLAVAVLRVAIFKGMLLRMLAAAVGLSASGLPESGALAGSGSRRADVGAYAAVIRRCVFGAAG